MKKLTTKSIILNNELIPYLFEYYKILEITDSEREFRLNQLLDGINRLKNLKV